MGDVVTKLKDKVDKEKSFEMVVRRECVLTDAFRRMQRASFDPAKTLKVSSCMHVCILLNI